MPKILESIFKGFAQWLNSLVLEIVQYIANSLLDVFTMDLDYFQRAAPVTKDILSIVVAAGWALLLGNLVFQALRSMASGLGIEGEDTKLLFARTFVFGFLLLASPQICETVLGMTSKVIALLEVPDAIHVQLVDGSVIGVFTASWLLVIICHAHIRGAEFQSGTAGMRPRYLPHPHQGRRAPARHSRNSAGSPGRTGP